MDLHIGFDGRAGLADQIYQRIRAAILGGLLPPGAALPSTRELAAHLGVSRNTVGSAYDRLAAEGYLIGRAGVGTYVHTSISRAPQPRRAVADGPRPRRIWQSQPDPMDLSTTPEYDLRPGLPDARRFPYATWRALLAREVRETAVGTGAYGDPAGHPRLRAALARHVGVSRGVSAGPHEVLVTSGAQQAVDLVGRVLLEPGDVAVVEDPGWWPPKALFETMAARVVTAPVDREGLVVDALPERAKLVCVSPSHQFPLGVTMSLPRRQALLAWARRAGALIIEDDYDSEFRYAGRPLEPLHSLAGDGGVLYVGSFSKTLLPTLRLGFCVVPEPLQPALRKAKYLLDWHTALPTQAALARFIDEGLLARHLRRMRRMYQDRRDRVLHLLARDFADVLEPLPSVAGLHLAALLRVGTPDAAIAERASAAGVEVGALSGFGLARPGPAGLLFGFGAIPLERIDEGLRRLRGCFPA